jgi:hypothetical protein
VPAAGAGDESQDGGGASATLVADEQVVFSSQRDPLHLLLGEIVVDGNRAVAEERRQGFPLVEHIPDRLGHGMLGEQLPLPLQQPLVQRLKHRRALSLLHRQSITVEEKGTFLNSK